mmetsp:Transcript_40354/g.95890  ORF Transcript_40354/g.95890 Transcript_40354/m.95890 type:complete len:752 (+) Transcript_40354:178-2433(+)
MRLSAWLCIACFQLQIATSLVSTPREGSPGLLVGSDLQKTRDAASTGLRGPHQVLGKEGLAVSADGLDMEDAAKGIEAVAEELDNEARELKLVEAFVSDLVHYRDWTRCSAKKTMRDVLNRARHIVSKKHRIFPPLSRMLRAYESLVASNTIEDCPAFRQTLVLKEVRSWSGVLVVTLFTAPGKFSCPMDCHYCPNEVDANGTQLLPRSYLSTEPGCKRGLANGFDCVRQFRDRVACLKDIGHTVDKIEVLVLGGTWSYYPLDYQEEFIRDVYFAANTLDQPQDDLRERGGLLEEQHANEKGKYKIIGITLETRPDFINKAELRRFRRYGVTRMQIGLQHTDDAILEKINRKCTQAQGVKALRLLKECCFKVDIHLMPDLPGSDPAMDKLMLEKALYDPEMDADYYKIYPTSVTPFTTIEKWYREGSYKPYGDENDGHELIELLIWFKSRIQEWKRINRIPRDIPNNSIIAGNSKTNLRQILQQRMATRGLQCRCIRCREVKNLEVDLAQVELVEREHRCQGGLEYFLSFETKDRARLLGFLRLRFNSDPSSNIFPELKGAALIRELHVYGAIVPTYSSSGRGERPQHGGLGRRLVARAEQIAYAAGFQRVAIISGVGVREYYRRLGYALEGVGQYMVKTLDGSEAADPSTSVQYESTELDSFLGDQSHIDDHEDVVTLPSIASLKLATGDGDHDASEGAAVLRVSGDAQAEAEAQLEASPAEPVSEWDEALAENLPGGQSLVDHDNYQQH